VAGSRWIGVEGVCCHQPQVRFKIETPNPFMFCSSFVLFSSASDGAFGITWASNGSHKTVSRLNLIFEGEDPARHIQRRSAAVKRREMYEQSMRYNVFVRGLPVEDQLKPSMEQVLSIFKRAGAMVHPPPPTLPPLPLPSSFEGIIITNLFD
jgi:hypothetical protein